MSDAFENKIREKLSEADIPFDADAWKKMEKKLDGLDDNDTNRRSAWWWLAPLLLLFIGTGAFMWWRSATPPAGTTQETEKTTNTATIQQTDKQPLTPTEKVTPGKATTATKPVTPAQQATRPSSTQENNTVEKPAVTPVNPATGRVAKPSPLVNKSQRVHVLSYPVPEQATGTDTRTVEATNNILHLLATLYPDSPVISTKLNGSSNIPLKETSAEKPKQKEIPAPRKGFTIGVMLGPVFNVAPSLQYGRIGLDGGVLLSYHVNNRWSFTTGAVYSTKPYGGTRDDYGVIKKWGPPTNPNYAVKRIDANCDVLDVPLNINYAFMDKANYTLSATAGLSSYFMLKEKYNYKYQNAADYEKMFTNQNQHYLSVLNLAFTYQFPLNNQISIGIQPFAKIPLRAVGYGEVKLYSSGVAVQMNFNMTKRKR